MRIRKVISLTLIFGVLIFVCTGCFLPENTIDLNTYFSANVKTERYDINQRDEAGNFISVDGNDLNLEQLTNGKAVEYDMFHSLQFNLKTGNRNTLKSLSICFIIEVDKETIIPDNSDIVLTIYPEIDDTQFVAHQFSFNQSKMKEIIMLTFEKEILRHLKIVIVNLNNTILTLKYDIYSFLLQAEIGD